MLVELLEPSEAAAEEMLLATCPAFERHHGVRVTAGAVRAAVRASRALRGRHLPDRALDVLDDAACLASAEGQEVTREHALRAARQVALGAGLGSRSSIL